MTYYYKVLGEGFKTKNDFDWMPFLKGKWAVEKYMGIICPKCKYKEVEEFEDKTMMFSKIYECLNCHYLFTIEDTEFRQKEYYPELLEELR